MTAASDAQFHPEQHRRNGAWAVSGVLGLLVWGWALIWVQRLPFFTDDYSRWLATAHDTSWGQAVLRVLNPWGGTDATWGFAYRPVIVLWFKTFGLSGTSSTLFFTIKAALLAGLCTLCLAAAHRVTCSWAASVLGPLILVTSHGVLASLCWGGDMAVLADLLIMIAVWTYARLLAEAPARTSSALLAIVLTLLAIQTKGNGRLLPAIFLAGLLLARKRPGLTSIAPIIAGGLFSLPLGPWIVRAATPTTSLAGDASTYSWHRPLVKQLWELTLGGTSSGMLHPFAITPSQGATLWPLGWVIALAVTLAGAISLTRPPGAMLTETDSWERHFIHMVATWAAAAVASMASYPAINVFYQHRFAIDTFVPASLLVAFGAGWILRTGSRAVRIAMAGILLVAAVGQAWFGAIRMRGFREAFAQVATIADKLNRSMAAHPDAVARAYVGSYVPYDFWPPLPGRPHPVARGEDLARQPSGTYAYAWDLPLVKDTELVTRADGLSGAWVERFYARPAMHAFLVRRVLASPMRSSGVTAATAGDWNRAVMLLQSALHERDTIQERWLLGVGLLQIGQAAGAAAALAPLAALDRNGLRPVRSSLALALLSSDRAPASVPLYEELVRENPNDVVAAYNLGVAYRRSGRIAEARRAFQSVLTLSPGHEGARANLAELPDGA
jgi:hypothetical protein